MRHATRVVRQIIEEGSYVRTEGVQGLVKYVSDTPEPLGSIIIHYLDADGVERPHATFLNDMDDRPERVQVLLTADEVKWLMDLGSSGLALEIFGV